ncbi:Uncharacterised protein [Serratia quinivorans]|nr:Uncharacterised protein [Serratia quinivorans]
MNWIFILRTVFSQPNPFPTINEMRHTHYHKEHS